MAASCGRLPVGCVALLISFQGETSLTHEYFLWKAAQARRYWPLLGALQGFLGHWSPRERSNETSGRAPCARAACSHASSRAGSLKMLFHGVTSRAYLTLSTWKSGSLNVPAC